MTNGSSAYVALSCSRLFKALAFEGRTGGDVPEVAATVIEGMALLLKTNSFQATPLIIQSVIDVMKNYPGHHYLEPDDRDRLRAAVECFIATAGNIKGSQLALSPCINS